MRSMRRTMFRSAAAAVAAAAALTMGTVAQAQAQAPDQTQSTDQPSPRGSCPEHQDVTIDGATASYDIICNPDPTGEVIVRGRVEDTRPDGLCAQVYAQSMATDQNATVRAGNWGEVRTFEFHFGPPGVGARVLVSLEGGC